MEGEIEGGADSGGPTQQGRVEDGVQQNVPARAAESDAVGRGGVGSRADRVRRGRAEKKIRERKKKKEKEKEKRQ